MGGPTHDAKSRGAHLSRALKALRRRRGVGTAEMAASLGMARRSYQHFESGLAGINLERVHRIARILNADPFAVFAAIDIGSPEFAVRAADNKLMTIIMIALRDFDAAAGDAISQLDARVLSSVFERAFNELAALAQERTAAAERWAPPDADDPEDA